MILIFFELFLLKIFLNLKKIFPWIIDAKDLYPKFDENRFKNFKKKRYSEFLGWDNKPKMKFFDILDRKRIYYEINPKGQRKNTNKKKSLFASFGDSYVFCRQVKDNDTWQEIIAKKNNYKILNYGVGNYGIDQSILKYSKTNLDKNVKYIIQGFVPETICRVQSQWKHFLEFGNLHGFKPKFYLSENHIKLKKNPLLKNSKIKDLKKIIKKLTISDRFYLDKFEKYRIKFPFTISFFLNLRFNFQILSFYIYYLLFNSFKKKKINLYENLFSLVVKNNLIFAHCLYKENYSKLLLSKLIIKFIEISKKKKHYPILIIFPQLIDIKLKKTNHYYINYFNSLKTKIDVIDLTNEFKGKDLKKMFINDKYGGHLSKFGNKFVAKIINDELKKIMKSNNEKNLQI